MPSDEGRQLLGHDFDGLDGAALQLLDQERQGVQRPSQAAPEVVTDADGRRNVLPLSLPPRGLSRVDQRIAKEFKDLVPNLPRQFGQPFIIIKGLTERTKLLGQRRKRTDR
ncbi:hypothetical protein [Xanthobacter sp. 126]|uniref:hypothetical protein n=1 Tax=Xanthobacter sp. 126 TaxID=1131814 RepID=UPI00045E6A44|nr:hypothetical protein [Xanthobacter sp. 126]